MKTNSIIFPLSLLVRCCGMANGFAFPRGSSKPFGSKHQQAETVLYSGEDATIATQQDLELSPPQAKVRDILTQIHESGFEFRIVVVGNGAILETTSVLGPTAKVSQSPATGEPLMTLASADQRFEFHVKLAQVSKVTLAEKKTPDKVMRILRFLTETGTPMCSLICSPDAAEWFEGMTEEHGTEIQL